MRSARLITGLLFVLFGFVVSAHDFAVGIHFNAGLFAVLLNNGFIIGAFFFPADNRSAFGLRLGSLLHGLRHIRSADGLLFVFLSGRLCAYAHGQARAD